MKDRWGKKKNYLLAALAAMLATVPGRALAAEGALCPPERAEEDIVSVELPVLDENGGYPFDFILDPQGLLYETDAMRYGGGTVEEGAALLFRNREGEYDFSRTSDRLTVTNRGPGSVRVTVSAQVSGLGEMTLREDADFSGSQACSIYLALTDSEGHVQPLCAEKETLIACEMDSGAYSFGLTGACNTNADWEHTPVHPVVTVTWIVEPIDIQQKEGPGEEPGETRQEGGGFREDTPEGKGGDVGEEESGMQETGPDVQGTGPDVQETEPGSEGSHIGKDDASQPGDTPGKEEADIEEENAGEQEDAVESEEADIEEDNAGEQKNAAESGEANIEEGYTGEREDAVESEEADIEEDNAGEQKNAAESGEADIEEDNAGEQMNPAASGHAETGMAAPATEETGAESEGADTGKESAEAPAKESGDSGTEADYSGAEMEYNGAEREEKS